MISPRTRLLIWTAIVVLPFATLSAVSSEAAPVGMALILLFALMALLDSLLAIGSLDGIGVELPKLARFCKDRQGLLELRFKNERQKGVQLRLALPLPSELQSAHEDLVIQLPAG